MEYLVLPLYGIVCMMLRKLVGNIYQDWLNDWKDY